MKKGKVYLVGAGPGDPDLITLKGLKVINQADVIIYDYLVDRGILKYADEKTRLISADKLYRGMYSNGFSKRQNKINEMMIKEARKNKLVVRLKNGDPFIFGRASEEMQALIKNKIKYVVIPGVTAFSAAAAFSGIPLTARGISSGMVIATGHETLDKKNAYVRWENIAKIETIVLYMAVENLSKLVIKLINCGRRVNTPVAVISNISRLNQKMVQGTLQNIVNNVKKEKVSAPAIIIIGEVVKKERVFNWFRKSKKILFTGISKERFLEEGIFFHVPMIEIKPLDNYSKMHTFIRKINKFDWIIFSSRYGVYYFFRELFNLGLDTRILNNTGIAAVGSSTANKLKEYGVVPDLVPKIESSKGLLSEFKRFIYRKNVRIFLPRSDIADKGLTDGLKRLGAIVDSCIAYKNVMPDELPDMDLNFFDEIIFTSPSTVRNFVKRYGIYPRKVKIKTIGEVTKKELKKYL